jgi:hypothetical protein
MSVSRRDRNDLEIRKLLISPCARVDKLLASSEVHAQALGKLSDASGCHVLGRSMKLDLTIQLWALAFVA